MQIDFRVPPSCLLPCLARFPLLSTASEESKKGFIILDSGTAVARRDSNQHSLRRRLPHNEDINAGIQPEQRSSGVHLSPRTDTQTY